jgi:hypothetical protein
MFLVLLIKYFLLVVLTLLSIIEILKKDIKIIKSIILNIIFYSY